MPIETSPSQPQWLHELIREVAKHVSPLGILGELGFRYLPPDSPQNTTQQWLVGLYLIPYGLSGGKHDGAAALAGFGLDVLNLTRLFSRISTLEWRVPRSYNDGLTGPEVWLEGVYRDEHRIQLHIYADPPSDELPALVLDVATNTLRAQ